MYCWGLHLSRMVECPAPGLYSDQLPESSQLKGELQVLQCGSSLCPHSASTLPRVPIQSDPYQYSIKFAPQLAGEKFNEPANRYLEVIPRPISTNLSCISGMMTAVTPPQLPSTRPNIHYENNHLYLYSMDTFCQHARKIPHQPSSISVPHFGSL